MPDGHNIVLIGMMGSGKTTVGRILAERLGRPFVDIDEVVEQRTGATVAELFERDGEPTFRRYESEAIAAAGKRTGRIVALGGGAVLDIGGMVALRRTSNLIWLDTPVEVLASRLTNRPERRRRPLLSDASDLTSRLGQMREDRLDAYRRAATMVLETDDRSPQTLAEDILSWAASRRCLRTSEEQQ